MVLLLFLLWLSLHISRKSIDPATGKSTSEKGMVARVVKDLVGPLSGLNHVVYMDNYFTSGPLVEELAQDKIYVAIKKNSSTKNTKSILLVPS